MKDFNDNENTPVKVNRPTYNWLNKLIETQTWENCFYYISRKGFGYGFPLNIGVNIHIRL